MNKMDIVKQARTWLGTPFVHQGRVKHVGADCLGMVVGVLKDLNISSKVSDKKGGFYPLHHFDQTVYSVNPTGEQLQKTVQEHLRAKEISSIEPGDIVLMKWLVFPQHVAIVSDYGKELGLIHSYKTAKKCVEHNLNSHWGDNIVEAYEVILNG